MQTASSIATDPLPTPGVVVRAPWVSLRDLAELTKPRITKLVVVTSLVGFAMAAMIHGGAARSPWTLAMLALAAAIGTALCSSGAAALNEWLERVRDSKMKRTEDRPIPAGRLSARAGLTIGLTLCALGLATLWAFTNIGAMAVALATIVSYVWLYTPLKPYTPLATIVGAAPGALPPLIGWTAAWPEAPYGLDHPGGWSIFAIMAVWQIPHFLALAWKYREDYARGGHRVLPVVDPTGVSTAWSSIVWTLALIPISLASVGAMRTVDGRLLLGAPYTIVALLLGLAMLFAAIRFGLRRDDKSAATLFFGSIAYLPLILIAMVGDAIATSLLG